jgi:hypothetical protein
LGTRKRQALQVEKPVLDKHCPKPLVKRFPMNKREHFRKITLFWAINMQILEKWQKD